MSDIAQNNGLLLTHVIRILNEIAARAGHRLDTMTVQVIVHRPGSIGGTPTVHLKSIGAGFDWDAGKVMLRLTEDVSQITQEERDAIVKHARDGQSHRAYQDHQKIKALQDEVTELKLAIARQGGTA